MTQSSYGVVAGEKKKALLLLCEHASPHIPDEYENLGIDQEELHSHHGWDIGALQVLGKMVSLLNVDGIYTRVSRLLIDFNRQPDCEDLIRKELEPGKPIPGNIHLSEREVDRRIESYWKPFHNAVEKTILSYIKKDIKPFLISLHSFTPVFQGKNRDLDVGLLFYPPLEASYALSLELREALEQKGLSVEFNQPYSVEDPHPYPLHHYALQYDLSYLAVEIKNNLIDTLPRAEKMGEFLAQVLKDY